MTEHNQARTFPLRMPPGWQPPYPAFESILDANATKTAMAVIGCQFEPASRAAAFDFISGLAQLMRSQGAADHVDLSQCGQDRTGRMQLAATGYWLDPAALQAFFATEPFKAYWARNSADGLGYGIFREVFNIPLARFETLHSGPDHIVGIANARTGISEPIDTHAYWGSMRDRIPNSAADAFEPVGAIEVIEQGANRIVVRPNQNLAIIRSGQDLSAVQGIEREEYFSDVEPALRAGMNFLRDQGRREVNCYDCRFMALLDERGAPSDHTFGLAYFESLKDLENWAEHHPTHLAIFNAFLNFAPRYGPAMKSRYWHEVAVVPAEGQVAEYINCAEGTGMSPAS